MKIVSSLTLIVTSFGLWSKVSQVHTLSDSSHPSYLSSTTPSLHKNGQMLSAVYSQSLHKRGACIGKHPCQQDNTPPQTPRRNRKQSSEIPEHRTPPRNHPLSSDVSQGPALSSPGVISSFGTLSPYITPQNRSPARQQDIRIGPEHRSRTVMRSLLYTSSSSDFPSPLRGTDPARIGTPVRLDHIRSRPLTGPRNPVSSLAQVPSLRREAPPSLNRVRNPERASSSSQRTDVTIGEVVPDVQARAHETLSNFYSRIARSKSSDDPRALANRARWETLHKVHRASSEHYSQMSSIMKSSGADLLPMEN